MRFALLASALIFAACTDASPCGKCPAMEGTYRVMWEAPVSRCAVGATRMANLIFTRAGSGLQSTVGEQPLTGTLFDTYDFTLSGGLEVSYFLKGRLVLGGSADAGSPAIHLVGTLRSSVRADGGTFCDTDEPFTADKK